MQNVSQGALEFYLNYIFAWLTVIHFSQPKDMKLAHRLRGNKL
jgi:hypothetical protein